MAYYDNDPHERVQRRLNQRLMPRDPIARFEGRRPAAQQQSYQLKEQDRNSILRNIAGKTMGSLYKFANVLDLPVSSVRDSLAGENPFDQWLSPTTDDNRVQSRDLLRKYGLIGRKDTWGNLAGGIATDILLDPLTWATFGIGGMSSAASKMGLLGREAGLLEHLPGYMNKLNANKIAAAAANADPNVAKALAGKPLTKELLDSVGVKVPLVGKREAKQSVKSLTDIIDSVSNKPMRDELTKRLDAAAERFGFKDYAEFAAKNTETGLQNVMRFGAPNWKMFGANMKNQFQQAPHVMLGKSGSPTAMNIAKKLDSVGHWIEDTKYLGPAVSATKSLLNPAVMGMMDPTNQRIAKQHWAEMKLGHEMVGEKVSDVIQHFDDASGGLWTKMKKMGVDEFPEEHRKLREMFELYDKAPNNLKSVVDQVYRYNQEAYDGLKAMGVDIAEHEDDFVHYFARKITDILRPATGEKMSVADLAKEIETGAVTNVFNEHFLGRHGLFTDIKGGTKAIDDIATDDGLWQVVARGNNTKEKIDLARRYIKHKHRNLLPNEFRGEQLSRADLSAKGNQELTNVQKLLTEVRDQSSYDQILNNASLTEAQKIAEVQKKMRKDFGVRLNPNAEKDLGRRIAKGEQLVQPGDRIFTAKTDRQRAFAEFLVKNEDRADVIKQYGLFGNHPFWDLEKSLQAHQDSFTRANMVMDMLSQPGAVIAGGSSLDPGKATSLTKLLKTLGFNADGAVGHLGQRLGIKPEQLKSMVVDSTVARDLNNIEKFFHGPESVTFFGKIMDSMQSTFKSNVTSPFPAFHVRNFWSGQLRNAVGNAFSVKSVVRAWKMLHGKDIEGVENIPWVKQRWEQIVSESGDPAMRTVVLDNARANHILRNSMRPHEVVGAYGPQGVTGSVQSMAAASGAVPEARAVASTAAGIDALTPGANRFGWNYTFRKYFGLPTTNAKGVKVKETVGPNPFNFADPFEVGNMLKRGASKLGYGKSRGWGDAAKHPLVSLPPVLRTPGAYEGMGLARNARRIEDAFPEMQRFGPVEAGFDYGHAVEFMNRVAPILHKLENGSDLSRAVREVTAMQIPYGAKHYTPFENKVLKRIFPFYSFTSRSLPWAMNKFLEQPGNLLNQVIRGTTQTGRWMQEKYQAEGPVPPHLRDTLAIPVPYSGPEAGTKRFFTGVDVMSQDLWQLMMPLLSGNPGEFAYELLGRANPLAIKAPLELATGTSLFQRGVEAGRPLKNMDPPFGRLMANMNETWSRLTGEEIPPGSMEQMERWTLMENLLANSPLSRYLSTARTAFDPRKGIGAKLGRLVMAAGIQDVSPRAQQAIVREYLRDMMRDSGGKIFEKASFPKDYMEMLKRSDPQQYEFNMKLKLLNDELAKTAKLLNEKKKVIA